jgi:hypothetical protein
MPGGRLRLAGALLCWSCASAVAPAPFDDNVRGCWIERRGAEALTMRWLRGAAGAWNGEMLAYASGVGPERQRFALKPEGRAGWTICPLDEALPHGPPCMPAFFGAVAEEGAEWMELHADPRRLRFLYRTGGDTLVLFDGQRDGCD